MLGYVCLVFLLLIPFLAFDHVFAQKPDIRNPYAPMYFDKEIYTWTDIVRITVVAPSWNSDSDLINSIGDSQHPVSISTRSSSLKPYRLVETGTNTGIFVGEVTLTGFSHDADGNINTGSDGSDGRVIGSDTQPRTFGDGPTNGFLETTRDDAITISFEFTENLVLTNSALIKWNIGSVEFMQSSYTAEQLGVVRVIDPDMNLDPKVVDQVPVRIFSDSDNSGTTVQATETNQETGIFEATITFTHTNTSSGNRLFVMPRDTIFAEYEDNTLPRPYSTSDNLRLTSSATIDSDTHPLERVSTQEIFIADSMGNPMMELSSSNQMQIVGDIRNEQSFNQDFVYLMQVKNEHGITVSLSWVLGQMQPYQKLSLSQSWIPNESGRYTIDTFVWDSLRDATPLAPTLSKTYLIE